MNNCLTERERAALNLVVDEITVRLRAERLANEDAEARRAAAEKAVREVIEWHSGAAAPGGGSSILSESWIEDCAAAIVQNLGAWLEG